MTQVLPRTNPERRETIVIGVLLLSVAAALGVAYGCSNSPAAPVLTMWLAGAVALGLLAGFTTGASLKEGTSGELIGFIGAGIVVPILGGIAALMRQPEVTTETSNFPGDQATRTVTEVATKLEIVEFHPLWVSGSFFVAFGVSAIIGIALGVRRRNEQINNASAGLKLRAP